MSYLPQILSGEAHQFEREVAEQFGDVISIAAKATSLTKFGRNEAVSSSGQHTLMEMLGSESEETYVASDLIDSVVSDDATNTQEVTISGHTISGSDLTAVSQTATLNGLNEVTLSTPLARVSRIFIAGAVALAASSKVYVYDNTGVSDPSTTGGVPDVDANVHIIMSAADNQSLKASTSLSSIEYLGISRILISVNKLTTARIDVRFRVRQPGGVFRTIYPIITLDSSAQGVAEFHLSPWLVVPKNSDIVLTAEASANNTSVSGAFQGYFAKII